MRFPCSDTARIIVDGKFSLIVRAGETILSACRNSAIYISANCADGTCRDCVVDIKNQAISDLWTEALACQQITADGMSIRRKSLHIKPQYSPKSSWKQRLEKLRLSKEVPSNKESVERESKMFVCGEIYSRTTGVDLKFDSETDIDWNKSLSWSDTEEVVLRCMAKYADTTPYRMKQSELIRLVKNLPNFQDPQDPDASVVSRILDQWSKEYAENLENVTFKNLASYEP